MKKSSSSKRIQTPASETSKKPNAKAPRLTPMFEATQNIERRISLLEQQTIEMDHILAQLKRDMRSVHIIKHTPIESDDIYTEISTAELFPILSVEHSLASPIDMESKSESKIGDLAEDSLDYIDDIPFVNVDLQVGSVITLHERNNTVNVVNLGLS